MVAITSIRSEISICGRFDKRVEQDVRNKDEVVDSIPSTNRWANRIYKSGAGVVFRECDRICRENKKSTWGSNNSTKKNIRGDEAICR